MENKIVVHSFKSPYGELILGDFNERLCLCDWKYRKMRSSIDARIQSFLQADYIDGNTELIQVVLSQLDEYFKKQREEFEIPLIFTGSEFQNKVWAETLKILYGETETYLGLSKRLENEKAVRAVASANGANAISIIVPCHRILGSKGEMVGYAGGLLTKRKLLELEGFMHQGQAKLF